MTKLLVCLAGTVFASSLVGQQFARLSREAVPRSTGSTWTRLVDLDGDGDLDLYFRTDAWLRNDGSGRFVVQALSGGNGGIQPPVVGDFDGDGDRDLLNGGAVLENRGALGPQWLACNVTGQPLSTGDLDGDGKTDVVSTFGIALATSVTTFQGINNAASPAAEVADVDGDGDLDVVRATPSTTIPQLPPLPPLTIPGQRFVSRNDGGGVWVTTYPFGFNLPSASAVLAFDADGDGDVDLGFLQSNAWDFWRNQGGGVFTAWPALTFAWGTLLVRDFDGDGDPDVVGAGSWSENLGGGVYVGRTFASRYGAPHDAGDVDGDSDLDLVFGELARERHVLLQQAAHTFVDPSESAWAEAPAPEPLAAAGASTIGDVDADGFLDVFVAAANSGDRSWRSRGDGWFRGAGMQSALLLADGDGDGDLDVFEDTAHGFANDGNGSFSLQLLTLQPPGGVLLRHAFDGDGDGDVDLVRMYGTTLELLRNMGNWTYAAAPGTALPGAVLPGTASAAADFDGDGDIDLLFGFAPMRLYANDGTGVFSLVPGGVAGVPAGGAVSTFAVGDVDGDGDRDVLVGRDSGPAVLLRNSGALVADPTALPASLGSSRVAMGDLDADGDVDIVAGGAAQDPNRLAVWHNTGAGTFVFAEEIPAAGVSALVDVDRDGDLDLFTEVGLLANRTWHAEAPFLPQIGRSYTFRCGGRAAANGLAVPVFGTRGYVPLPGLGVLGVDPATAIPLAPLLLVGEMADVSFPVPASAALLGLPFSMQAVLLANGSLHLTPPKHEVVAN